MEDGAIEKKSIPNYDEKVARLLQNQKRLSLAYGALNDVPYLILEYIAEEVQILDLSYNKFQDLGFLENFSSLQTLILDKNSHLDPQTFPKMDKLEILWLNNCNLVNITEWLETLQVQCPALKQLSMMCNPVGLTVLNGVSDRDEEEYRKQVIKILPNLEYFDGIRITDRQRKIATQSKTSFALLDEVFRLKMKSFIEISANIHKTFMSVDKLNAVVLKNKAIASKNMYT